MHNVDVAIIGGGPAGSATALMLRKQFPDLLVAVVERSDYTKPRIGESLQPLARSLFEQLGIWGLFTAQNHLPAYGSRAIWGGSQPYDNEFLNHARGNGWHLDRSRFDSFLLDQAGASGALLFKGYRLDQRVSGGPGSWIMKVVGKEAEKKIRARFVVDAGGRAAVFATAQGAEKKIVDRLISSWRVFPAADCDTYTLVEAMPDGWWYSALLPDKSLMVSFMGDQKVDMAWFDELSKTRYTAARIASFTTGTSLRFTPAFSQCLSKVAGPGWLAVGDAASTLDPLSSQGIFKAIRTGIFAAYSVGDYLKGRTNGLDRYQQLIEDEYLAYLQKKTEFYQQEQRWPNHQFWKKRQDGVLDQFSDLAVILSSVGN